MDTASFERVYDSFQGFHGFFAASFGRKQWREHSRNYLRALLVQAQERRNAENLSESLGISARAMQRFLTEARWSDDTVIGRLQEYLAPRLGHPEAVWVFDGSDFPKQGRKSAGVARQYCGRLGKVANCQAGMFLACVSPLGRALVDKGLYLPQSWTSDPGRCAGAGVPEARRGYRSKTELALELLERALQLGHLEAGWVAGDDAFGMSPFFRDGLAALGMRYVLDVPGSTPVWPLEPEWTSPEYQGCGRPRKPKLGNGQRRTMEQRSDELPDEAWREITVAQGSQGPRTYQFSAQRVRPTAKRKPGEIHWALYRRNLDGSEPPRVRGNLRATHDHRRRCRSIPASAGEPWLRSPSTTGAGVYPRECGGTTFSVGTRPLSSGLSPRVRGNHIQRRHTAPEFGSIPASAGEPRSTTTPWQPRTVYPRECGGT